MPMFELIDKDGNTWGQYSSAQEAATFAKSFWPDQEQDPDRTGAGWDIQVCSDDAPPASRASHYS